MNYYNIQGLLLRNQHKASQNAASSENQGLRNTVFRG